MTESTRGEVMPAQSAKMSDLTLALILIGFACLLAGILSVEFSGALVDTGISEGFVEAGLVEGNTRTLSLFLWFGMFLSQFLSYTPYVEQSLPKRYVPRVLVFSAAFSLLLALLALPALTAISLPAVVIGCAWFFLGGLCGLLLPIWGNAWTAMDAERSDNRTTALMVAWSAVASVFLCSFTLFAPPLVSILTTWIFFIASICLVAYCSRLLPKHQSITLQASKMHLNLFSRNLLVPAVLTLVLGTVLCYCLFTLPSFTSLLCLLFATVAAALIMVIVLLVLKSVPRQSTFERWVISVCSCALALLILDSQRFELISILVILVSLILYTIFHFTVLIALSYRHQVLTLYHYAQGLIAPIGGIVIGWLVMTCLLLSGIIATGALWQVMTVLLLLLLLTVCIVPFKSNQQAEGVFIQDEVSDASAPGRREHMDDSTKKEAIGFWKQRMQIIAETHQLSPREVEVFALLAKGRNAEHISKTLYISTHTVKTHIYRIYRKLQVNTQQELIDMVDEQQLEQ